MTSPLPTPARGRGRPRAFDRDTALRKALDLFWKQGYEGTSIADLTAAIGITAPSLYATFKSKERLYGEVLDYYRTQSGRMVTDSFSDGVNAYQGLRHLLEQSAQDFANPQTPAGCLIACAILTSAPENQGARDLARQKRDDSIAMLAKIFTTAQQRGELPDDSDCWGLARFYGAVLQGMSVQAMDGASHGDLARLVSAALLAWPGSRT